jgi:hypothetical protein
VRSGGRDRYPLAALETLRRRAFDAARGSLAEAVSAAEGASARAAASSALVEAAVAGRRGEEGRSPVGTFADLAGWSRWLSRLRSDERRARAEREARLAQVAVAEGAVAACRAAVADAERQLEAVRRHREGWERARRVAAASAAEAELEDLAGVTGGQRAT